MTQDKLKDMHSHSEDIRALLIMDRMYYWKGHAKGNGSYEEGCRTEKGRSITNKQNKKDPEVALDKHKYVPTPKPLHTKHAH